MKNRLRDNPPPVTESNAIHLDAHDPCYPCTRCRRAVKKWQATPSQIASMSAPARAAIIRELVPTGEPMRVSEFHLQGILPYLLAGIALPEGLVPRKTRVADFLAHRDAILATMATDAPFRNEDAEPGFTPLPASCQHRTPLPVSGALSAK